MKIHEYLIERDQRRTRIMYHGTSDAHLGSILKHGLLANPPQKGFGSNSESLVSFDGVYLTPFKDYATDAAREVIGYKPGSQPILVKVQYVVTSGGPDEDLFFSKFIQLGLASYDHKPLGTYQEYMKLAVDTASTRLKQISTPTLASIKYTQEFYKELYRYISDRMPGSIKDIVQRVVEISKSIPLERGFTALATDQLISELNLEQLELSDRNEMDAHIRIEEIFGIIRSTQNVDIDRITHQVADLLWYFRAYGEIFNVTYLQANTKLRDIMTRILNSANDTSNDTNEVRINRNIGFRGKTRILEISNIDTGEILYPKHKQPQ